MRKKKERAPLKGKKEEDKCGCKLFPDVSQQKTKMAFETW